MTTFVLESADCHVTCACEGYDTRAGVPRGDKMSLLKHAGIST